jgi:hypothetical protein
MAQLHLPSSFRTPQLHLERPHSLRVSALAATALLATFSASSCSGGGGAPAPDAVALGSIAQHPDSIPQTPTYFVAEDPTPGAASSLQVLESYWGRLVEVYDVDGATPVFTNFVVDDQIVGDGVNYALERDPLTGIERLRILHAQDSTAFYDAVLGLEANLQVLLKKSVAPAELPPFSAVARNGALVLKFNDLLDPDTIGPETVKLLTGYAPSLPFEARIFPDPSHGNVAGGSFYSTRVIVDFTVSELEAGASGLPLNALGLPPALSTALPNVLVRIPSQESPVNQQFAVLRALGGRAISFTNNGPSDPLSPTLDVLRAFRSGGSAEVTGDANNGFLVDNSLPVVIGTQSVDLLNTLNFELGLNQPASIRFHTQTCAYAPQIGDVLEVNAIRMRVVEAPTGSPFNGVVGPFLVRPLCETCTPPVIVVNTTNPPAGTIRSPYRPQAVSAPDPNYPACFLTFLPAPTLLPASGVAIDATVSVTFSEPIDPLTVRPFDTFALEYGNNAPSTSALYANVVGNVQPSANQLQFTFQPSVPLRKVLPGGELDRYVVKLAAGAAPIRDLAGNELLEALPPAPFTVSALSPTLDSGGIRLKFDVLDEDADGAPEVRGQFTYDIQREALRPRAVQRFSAVVDPSVTIVGAMIDLPNTNIQTPLSNHGSRLMRVWRYHDVAGFSLRDDATHNVDIEGLWWQPFGGALQIDNFPEFQVSVAHSKFLPDENVNAGLLPMFPNSGLVQTFDNNLLDATTDPMTVIAPRARGYQVNPTDLAVSTSGNPIAPFPINRGIAPSEFTYWTWRDTAKTAVAAPNGTGADTARFATLVGAAANKGFYPANNVPTIGLPLLTEFRTYPSATSSGQNGFRIAIALNSSARPFFRVFSTGGVHPTSGVITPVHPDSSFQAEGGIDPNTGATTPWGDNTLYYGQADFLVRISRMHTVWLDTLGAATIFAEGYLEPDPSLQPTGTQVVIAYRGATNFSPATTAPHPYADANNLDSYGNLLTAAQLQSIGSVGVTAVTPSFVNASNTWRSSAGGINGARFVQLRVSFLSNPISGLSPTLSALGVAFRR